MDQGSPLERLLRRDRYVVAAGLLTLCALAWTYVVSGASLGVETQAAADGMAGMDMSGMDMSGMDMPGMDMSPATAEPGAWSGRAWLLTLGMWASMMVAMMTPSAAPTILLYGRVRAHAAADSRAGGLAPVWVFAAAYLLLWLGFSVVATGLQWGLERSGLLSSSLMASQSKWLSAAVLAGAGAYQLSPLKNACLTQCRAPAQFLSRHWRPGIAGAVRLGLLHGTYCVGCCWLLMVLLFVGGVMNLVWIAALTLLVAAEKLVPGGRRLAQATGVALIAWGLVTLLA